MFRFWHFKQDSIKNCGDFFLSIKKAFLKSVPFNHVKAGLAEQLHYCLLILFKKRSIIADSGTVQPNHIDWYQPHTQRNVSFIWKMGMKQETHNIVVVIIVFHTFCFSLFILKLFFSFFIFLFILKIWSALLTSSGGKEY